MATRAAKGTTIFDFDRIPKQVEKARAEAEKIVKRTWNDALDLLPTRPRKAVKEATTRVEKATRQFQKRTERTLKEISTRRKTIARDLERGAAKVVQPIVTRLDIASRADVEKLGKRLSQLERKIQQQAKKTAA